MVSRQNVKIDMSGECEDCKQFYPDLRKHYTRCHTNRDGICPFCGVHCSFDKLYRHFKHQHPIQSGFTGGVPPPAPEDREAMTGRQLVEYMRGLGMEITSDTANLDFYVTSFNEENRTYNWVAYQVWPDFEEKDLDEQEEEEEGNKETVAEVVQQVNLSEDENGNTNQAQTTFMYEVCTKIKSKQLHSADFSSLPSYSHGHGAPFRNFKGDTNAQQQSYLFVNISFQKTSFNCGIMASSEKHERSVAKRNHTVIVLTGQVFDDNSKVKTLVSKPSKTVKLASSYFKILLIQNPGHPVRLQCYKLKHVSRSPHLFHSITSLDELRRSLPYPLLPNLKDFEDSFKITDKTTDCAICGLAVPESDYSVHMNGHRQENTCTINQCFQKFANQEAKKTHQREAHRMFPCQIEECQLIFISNYHLQRHAITHLDEANFVCVDCGEKFKWEATLAAHRNKIHEEISNWYCPLDGCDDGFSKKTHILTKHSRARFKCEICVDNYFTRHVNLKKHMRKTHTEEELQDRVNHCLIKYSTGAVLDIVLKRHDIPFHDFTYRCMEKRKKIMSERGMEQEPCPSKKSRLGSRRSINVNAISQPTDSE